MKHNHHPLPRSYIGIIDTITKIKLVIAGKDPFPTAPTGIPFCKSSWEEQLKDNNSGLYVLRSIGISIEHEKENCIVPSKLFHKLATQGVVFINCSYHTLNTTGLLKQDYVYVDMALTVNEPIIRKAENVLLCGEAKIFQDKIEGINCFHNAVHPDIRNRSLRATEWHEWWAENAIKDIFDLNLS